MMRCDYHTHSIFSDDSEAPLEDMIRAAVKKGVKYMAVTDHYDPGYPDPEFPFILDLEHYGPALDAAKEQYAKDIEIAKGMEMGIMRGQLNVAREAVHALDFDYVIGSFHCYETEDFLNIDYSAWDPVELTGKFYEYVYEMLQEYKDYDVLGHMSIIDRYIGTVVDYTPYMELIREILKMVIADGKGIEINTSNFRYESDLWMPREEILKAYLELGGEIFTMGSDAHSPEYIQDHFEDAKAFVTSLGFKYYCTFQDRKPTFHSFD